MTADITSQKIITIKSGLLKEFLEAETYNPITQFINIDKVWQDPARNKIVSQYISDYISVVIPIRSVEGIITIDNVIYPYGPVPVASKVCEILNLQLGIWKENDNPLTGDHKLYGYSPEKNSLVLYDVTRFGLTALKLLVFLNQKGVHPLWFVTIVDCERGASELIVDETSKKLGVELNFISLLTLKDFSLGYEYPQRKE